MTEFELSPQEEAEKEFNGLMASPEIPDSVKAVFLPKETPLSAEIIEQTRESIESQIALMEKLGITQDGKINPDLVDLNLKEAGLENFPIPTFEQIQTELLSHRQEVELFLSLGLTRIILEPIACELGQDLNAGKDSTVKHEYTGLIAVVADKLRSIGKGNLKGSDGTTLANFNFNYPIYIDSDYQNLDYSILNDEGKRESIDLPQLIQDQSIEFKGWRIKFTTPDIKLKRNRDETDPLKEIKAHSSEEGGERVEFGSYAETLANLGLSGSTPILEIMLLLSSLDEQGQVTNDFGSRDEIDAYSILSGVSIKGSSDVPNCNWNRDDGRFRFILRNPGRTNDDAVARPLGELKI